MAGQKRIDHCYVCTGEACCRDGFPLARQRLGNQYLLRLYYPNPPEWTFFILT